MCFVHKNDGYFEGKLGNQSFTPSGTERICFKYPLLITRFEAGSTRNVTGLVLPTIDQSLKESSQD